jgi:4-hydroxybenzoate polyprenyltransferase
MGSMRGRPLAAGLVAVAVALAVLAVLYALGTISFLTTHPTATHHYQHAVVLGALCVASLVAASLVRTRAI